MAADPSRRAPRIVSIVGTRPEAIKMAPVVRAFSGHKRLRHDLLLTGQHAELAGFFDARAEAMQLRFDPRGRSAVKLREAIHRLLCGQFQRERADLVLVHGDTTSAFAAALAAHDCRIPVGHVEAGLRSFDLRHPWPEEGNRMAIDALSDLLFAPTERAAANLRQDHRVRGEIHVTGNTGIDALLHACAAGRPPPLPATPGRRRIVATCHRKENQGEAVAPICEALIRLARKLPVEVVLPLHTNPQVRRDLETRLSDEPHVRLLEPLGYGEMVALLDSCWIILTDSGGLQEEGPALGKPVLVLRDVTERPEALECGSIEIVGTEPGRIVAAVASLLGDPGKHARMSRPAFPFGDGRSAPRIVAAAETWLARRRRRVA